ncbi:unnamed protein product [Parnassius mnemosyne]|uniref:Mitochondrial ATPase inhibitor n=1 Tax=Parnassius mnemosyne TaxID=213953 RepID=A0AAV1L160_9NEOP
MKTYFRVTTVLLKCIEYNLHLSSYIKAANAISINKIRCYSTGLPGSGAGKGGGGGGTVRESGGSLGEYAAAQEESYFFKKQKELLKKIRKKLETGESLVRAHKEKDEK